MRRGAVFGVEVRVRTVRRSSWSAEDKLRIVIETLAPDAVAKVVADRHGIGTGLLTWRREILAKAMSGFAPIAVVPEPAAAAAAAARSRRQRWTFEQGIRNLPPAVRPAQRQARADPRRPAHLAR